MSNLSNLLLDKPISYYWIGFIMADGCFTGKNQNCLEISIHSKDNEHLEKFGKFIDKKHRQYFKKASGFNKVGYLSSRIFCQDKNICPIIRNKFDLQKCKTYNPPSFLPTTDKDLLLSLLCGIIDGDGYICNKYIRIKCHNSWISFYELLDTTLFSNKNPVLLSTENNCCYTISKAENIKYIKDKIQELCLPILDRKWNIK